jgi:hypothetical protein
MRFGGELKDKLFSPFGIWLASCKCTEIEGLILSWIINDIARPETRGGLVFAKTATRNVC